MADKAIAEMLETLTKRLREECRQIGCKNLEVFDLALQSLAAPNDDYTAFAEYVFMREIDSKLRLDDDILKNLVGIRVSFRSMVGAVPGGLNHGRFDEGKMRKSALEAFKASRLIRAQLNTGNKEKRYA